MNINISSPVKTGLVLVTIHTLLAVLIFFDVKNSAQSAFPEVSWLWLGFPDIPALYFGNKYFGSFLTAVDQNTKALVLVGVFGGAQWFLLGFAMHHLLKRLKNLRGKKTGDT
jgi:hypothetical protein